MVGARAGRAPGSGREPAQWANRFLPAPPPSARDVAHAAQRVARHEPGERQEPISAGFVDQEMDLGHVREARQWVQGVHGRLDCDLVPQPPHLADLSGDEGLRQLGEAIDDVGDPQGADRRVGGAMADALRERIEAHSWYHTLDLGDGLVTNGWFDLRPHVDNYGLPERMDGMRVLDVGTWDGFWAFEMERRGAEVVALDVDHEREYDWPPRRRPAVPAALDRGAGFRLAAERLGSRVERVVCNLYEARPETLGTFDVVVCGAVLIHMRDQLLALERLAGLCRGRLVFADEYDKLAEPAAVRRLALPRRPRTRRSSSGARRRAPGGG